MNYSYIALVMNQEEDVKDEFRANYLPLNVYTVYFPLDGK